MFNQPCLNRKGTDIFAKSASIDFSSSKLCKYKLCFVHSTFRNHRCWSNHN